MECVTVGIFQMYFFFNRYISARALFIWSSEFALLVSSAFLAAAFVPTVSTLFSSGPGNAYSPHLELHTALFLAFANLVAFCLPISLPFTISTFSNPSCIAWVVGCW